MTFLRIKTFVKNKKKTSILLGVILLGALFLIVSSNGSNEQYFVVERGDLAVVVRATGNIKPAEDASLSFGRSGVIAGINVKAGDKIRVGQELAYLNFSSLSADLLKARNALNEANISTNKTVRESKDQNINAWTKALSALNDAYSKEDDAIRNQLDKYFKNPRQYNTYIELPYYTTSIKTDEAILINSLRYKVELELINFEKTLLALQTLTSQTDTSKINNAFEIAKKNLSLAQDLLNTVATSVNGVFDDNGANRALLDEYKANISSARDQIALSATTLNGAKDAWVLAPKFFGASLDAEGVAFAQLEQKRAEISSIESQIRDSKIISPLNGVVSKKNISLGEAVTAGEEAFFVLADNDFYIEANVSEINIGKIAMDNIVEIILDAYPDRVFLGKIIYIENSETLVDGIVNYKIKVYGDLPKELIRSGLTANLSIFASSKNNVLKAPIYVFTKEGNEMTALVKTTIGSNEKRKVKLGFKASDGFVEVVSGLKLGETLILPKTIKK